MKNMLGQLPSVREWDSGPPPYESGALTTITNKVN